MNDPFENDPFDLSEPAAPAGAQPASTPSPYAPTPEAPTHYPSQPPLPPPLPGELQHAGFTCPRCGYDLTGAVIGGTCPECGGHINPAALTSIQSNGMAIASMVMGILALVLGFMTLGFATVAFAPLGIIFGHIAGRQLRAGRYNSSAKGFVITGLVCSYAAGGLVALVWGWFFIIVI